MTEGIETVWMPMPGGTQSAACLWLPEGARITPVPCILENIPYIRRDWARMREDSVHPHFASAAMPSFALISADQATAMM